MNALPKLHLPDTSLEALHDYAASDALDGITARMEDNGDVLDLLTDLHNAAPALDWLAAEVNVPPRHADAFAALLRRVRSLVQDVERQTGKFEEAA